MTAPTCAISLTGARRSSRASASRDASLDGQRRQGAIEPLPLHILDEKTGLQHRLGQLLDEQGDAVGLGDKWPHLPPPATADRWPLAAPWSRCAIGRAAQRGDIGGKPVQGGSNSGRKVKIASIGK
jgi:hypothetical protein